MLAKFAARRVRWSRALIRSGALFIALFFLAAHSSFAGQTNLAWDASTNPAVVGYFVYYGQTSGNYTTKIDVAKTTTYTVPNLVSGTTYYYAVTAYNATRTESGFSTPVSATIPTSPSAPVANFTSNKTTGAAPLAITFTSTSTGTIATYSWSFGDGTSSTAQNPAHSYSTAGTYTVTLSVSGSGGSNSLSKTGYITVSSAGLPKPAVVRQDFNGDAKDDILWRNKVTGENAIWQMNGAAISSGASITLVADPAWIIAGTGDFDGDGHSDILWRNSTTGENSIWLMNGSSISSMSFIPLISDKNWTVAGIGDFDGDGKADILWRNKSTGLNCVWLMNGVTIANSAFLPSVADPNWTIAGVGGFNGTLNTTTGLVKTDILWRNTATGQNAIWFMDGMTVSGTAFTTMVAIPWIVAGVADFNADGKADILWRNTATGENSIWMMSGASISSGVFITTIADLNWTIVGTGDYNGDGKADILWRKKTTGENAVWLMNGSSISSGAFTTPLADLNWVPIAH